jgi:hypothetical protein
MATLADMFSVPTEIEFEGKKYTFREPTQLEQGKYQRWLEQRADEAIDRKTWLSDEQRAEEKRVLNWGIAAGTIERGGEICIESLRSKSGFIRFIELVCNCPTPEAEALFNHRLENLLAVVRAKQASDPKAMRAALLTLGLPADWLNERRRSSSASARGKGFRKRKSRR